MKSDSLWLSRFIGLCFITLALDSSGQQKAVLVHDLQAGTIDSLARVSFDHTILYDQTDYFLGEFDSNIELLPTQIPTTNTYPDTHFTFKAKASSSLDLNHFPIRTTVKIFTIKNDSLKDNCSGSLISKIHVLTAAHCVSALFTDSLTVDSLKVFPIFDNGLSSERFDHGDVTKIYLIKERDPFKEDIAVLELLQPIGRRTGWLSVGFNSIDSLVEKGIYHKFSYPALSIPSIDPREYNGDTLFHSYGRVNAQDINTIAVNGASAIPGESGSSVIRVINRERYTSLGALSLSNDLKHSRVTNWLFYAIKDIIEDDLVLSSPIKKNLDYSIYPNPVKDRLFIRSDLLLIPSDMVILDNLGTSMFSIDTKDGIDVSQLAGGVYYLKLVTGQAVKTIRFLKL